MQEKSFTDLDFDAAAELAQTDPETFEQLRRNAIEALIARAPERNRQHLRSLQWRIDQERKRAANPTAACVKLYRMMWDSFAGRYGLNETLLNAHHSAQGSHGPGHNHNVLAFPQTARALQHSES